MVQGRIGKELDRLHGGTVGAKLLTPHETGLSTHRIGITLGAERSEKTGMKEQLMYAIPLEDARQLTYDLLKSLGLAMDGLALDILTANFTPPDVHEEATDRIKSLLRQFEAETNRSDVQDLLIRKVRNILERMEIVKEIREFGQEHNAPDNCSGSDEEEEA